MKSIDEFLRRTRQPEYGCLHFASDVWYYLTGKDIRSSLLGGHISRFTRLSEPSNPCIVLMQRSCAIPHVGIFFAGRVIHLTELGVEFQPVEIAARGFTSTRFYV